MNCDGEFSLAHKQRVDSRSKMVGDIGTFAMQLLYFSLIGGDFTLHFEWHAESFQSEMVSMHLDVHAL